LIRKPSISEREAFAWPFAVASAGGLAGRLLIRARSALLLAALLLRLIRRTLALRSALDSLFERAHDLFGHGFDTTSQIVEITTAPITIMITAIIIIAVTITAGGWWFTQPCGRFGVPLGRSS
jgi:hypothetical protein